MRLCFLTPEPDHPLLAAVADALAPDHGVESLHPDTARATVGSVADVYFPGGGEGA
ncbi:hypothetical protein ACFTWD_12130 [Streptomyces sp. NPDC056943]|uniref:hypothetical protein n=1 Tax=Streptomyces sp. NPDC056943 TaxID=3345971 RepID=UPI00363B5A17